MQRATECDHALFNLRATLQHRVHSPSVLRAQAYKGENTLALQAAWVYSLNLVQRWRYRHIPGPPPKWLLGNATEIQAKMKHGAYEEWAKKYGPVCRIFIGMKPLVIITGPS